MKKALFILIFSAGLTSSFLCFGQKKQPEILLTCDFSDRSNKTPILFLFSPKNKVDVFGQPNSSTDKMSLGYWLLLKETTQDEYIFQGTNNEAAYWADLGRKKYYPDVIKVNRKTLSISKSSNDPDPNSIRFDFYYSCEILDPQIANKYIKQIQNDWAESEKNKKPNKI